MRSSPPQRSAGPLDDADILPAGLRAAAGWSWRMLVVGVAIYYLLRVLSLFEVLVVPVLVAVLLVAFLKPFVDLVSAGPGRPGAPRGLASIAAIVMSLLLIAGLVTLIGQQVSTGFPSLRAQAVDGWRELQRFLAESPLHLTNSQLSQYIDRAGAQLQANSDQLVSGALQVGSTAADIGAGFFIVLFSTFFFLSGGDRIWAWVVRLFPRTSRARVNGAGVRAWATLTAYVRATVVVAIVDGAGVGIAAAILGVPLAFPLGVLVFLGAFIPIVGALVTGIVAVLVAIVAKGPVVALIMLGAVVAVQQVEAHVLQPFLMGRAVSVHPLAVILSIGAGVLLAGIVGGLFAVPIAAVVNVIGSYLSGEDADADGGADGDSRSDGDGDDPQQTDGEGPVSAAGDQARIAAARAGPLADEPVEGAERAAREGQ
jgi:predicted PurR-regulated permease PerM